MGAASAGGGSCCPFLLIIIDINLRSIRRRLLIPGKRDVRGSFEELFPKLGSLPYLIGMFAVIFDNWEDASCYYTVGAAEIVVDFLDPRQSIIGDIEIRI